MGSWSNLANMANTPTSGGSMKKSVAMQSFELFKRQAREKEERERLRREQEVQRRQNSEKVVRQRMMKEREKQRYVL